MWRVGRKLHELPDAEGRQRQGVHEQVRPGLDPLVQAGVSEGALVMGRPQLF